MIPSAIFHFTVGVLGLLQSPWRRWVRLSWLVSAFFAVAILSTDALIHAVKHYWWGYYPLYGWLSVPYLVFFFGSMLTSFRLYWVEYRKAVPGTVTHHRIRALMVAFVAAFLGSVDYLAKYHIPF